MESRIDTQSIRQKIGRFQIVGELGKGATGKVFLGEDPFARRKVAIKVMFPGALKSGEEGLIYKNMFLNEAALAGKLVHPHIVQIFDAVVEQVLCYILLAYVGGGTFVQFCMADTLLEIPDFAETSLKCRR